MTLPDKVDEVVANIKTMANLRLGSMFSLVSDLGNDFDGAHGVLTAAKEKFPNEEVVSAFELLVITQAWDDLDAVMTTEFRAKGYQLPDRPLLAAAPIGSLEACSISDKNGKGGLVFDTELLALSSFVLHEVSRLVCRETDGAVYIRSTPQEIQEDPEFEDRITWVARQLINLCRTKRELLGDFRHLSRLADSGEPDTAFSHLSRAFYTFLVAHEYAHFMLRHHFALFQAEEDGVPAKDMKNIHHGMEFEADHFAFQVVVKSIPNWNDKGHAILSMMGAFCFFCIVEGREEVSDRIKLGRHKTMFETADFDIMAFAKAMKRVAGSVTHPLAVDRFAQLFKSMSKSLGRPVRFEDNLAAKLVGFIFKEAEARAAYIIDNDLGDIRKVLLDESSPDVRIETENIMAEFHLKCFAA